MWNSKIVCWGITVLPGGLAGALWGLRSQLYYLSFTDWEYPEIRIPAGIVLGVLSGWILAFVLAYAKDLLQRNLLKKRRSFSGIRTPWNCGNRLVPLAGD